VYWVAHECVFVFALFADMVRKYPQCVEDVIPCLNRAVTLAKEADAKVFQFQFSCRRFLFWVI